MERSKDEYEKIGRAIVERIDSRLRGENAPFTLDNTGFDNAGFVQRTPRGEININISVDRYCPGCGLLARLYVEGEKLRVGYETDPLHLRDLLFE